MIHRSAGLLVEGKMRRSLRLRMLGCTPAVAADYGGNTVRRNTVSAWRYGVSKRKGVCMPSCVAGQRLKLHHQVSYGFGLP